MFGVKVPMIYRAAYVGTGISGTLLASGAWVASLVILVVSVALGIVSGRKPDGTPA